MRKLLFLFILLLATLVSATENFDFYLDLENDQYGPNQTFNGDIVINYSGNLSGGTFFEAYIDDIQEDSSTLLELLENSGTSYDSTEAYYEIQGNSRSSLTLTFADTRYDVVGVEIGNELLAANMTLLGEARSGSYPTYVTLDIGNDGVAEWQHSGDVTGWTNAYYPNGIIGNEREDNRNIVTGESEFCNDVNINLNELLDSTKMRINARARRSGSLTGGNLTASIDGLGVEEECDLPEPVSNTNYENLFCDITVDEPEDGEYEVCVYSTAGDYDTTYYEIPSYNRWYYFLNVNLTRYDYRLDTSVNVSGERIIDAFNEYYDDCDYYGDYNACLVPINVSTASSGVVTLNNIYFREDETNTIVDALYDLDYVPEKIRVNGRLNVPLNGFDNLFTPSSFGNHTLEIRSGGESNETRFSVTDVPTAVISASSSYSAPNYEIKFSGSGSRAIQGHRITFWNWNFGDNTTSTSESPSHSYYTEGTYRVSLVVKDDRGIMSSPAYFNIIVGSWEQVLANWINDTLSKINEANNFYLISEGEVKEVYGNAYYSSLINAESGINNLSDEYDRVRQDAYLTEAQRENRYMELADGIELIKSNNALSLDVEDRLDVYNDVIRSLDDIPVSSLSRNYADVNEFNKEIYNFNQRNVNIDTSVKLLEVTLLNGVVEEKVFVEKVVSSNGRIIVEDLGNVVSSLEDVTILTVGYTEDTYNNVIEWNTGSSTIRYLLNGNDLENVGKTVVFADVNIVTSGVNVQCGDGKCQYNDQFGIRESDKNNQYYCPKDCEDDFPWGIYITLLIVLVLGIAYFNFYKGPGNLKDISNFISVKLFRRRLFTNEQDLINLTNYVKNAFRNRVDETYIRKVLLQNGWTEKQISYVFKKAKR